MTDKPTEDLPPLDLLGYDHRISEALRRHVVRNLLAEFVDRPPPGDHHFYLTFRTDQATVPADLLEKYPVEMTVVIQHQYWDLVVTDTGFTVTLKFSGVPRVMEVPWHALTRFYDPTVQFLLQWEPVETTAHISQGHIADRREEPVGPKSADVVDLGQFRKPKG